MLYRRVPQCRICTSEHGSLIDRDLVARLPYPKIVKDRGDLFPADKPLTKACLYSHWKHLKEAVDEIVAQELVAIRSGLPATLDPSNEAMPASRQVIFQELVESELDEISTLGRLAQSGMTDLERLEQLRDLKAVGTAEEPDEIHVRNKVRRDTAAIVSESAKVKKLAVSTDDEIQRIEKGRIVLRMFELFRKSLETVPPELRPAVAGALKDGLRADDELKDLLKTHRTPGVAIEVAGVQSQD